MLKLLAFKFSDSDAMNAVLSTTRLAKGASVFVSNGEIVLPIEDGQLPNNDQKVALLTELLSDKIFELEIYKQSLATAALLLEKSPSKAQTEQYQADMRQQRYAIKNCEANMETLAQRIFELRGGIAPVDTLPKETEEELDEEILPETSPEHDDNKIPPTE